MIERKTKLCKHCNQVKPIDQFPTKGKTTAGNLTYGRCRVCQRTYEMTRPRGFGHHQDKEPAHKIPTIHSYRQVDPKLIKKAVSIPKRLASKPFKCKECGCAQFGGENRQFCSSQCLGRYYRRIRREAEERAERMKKVYNEEK
jgi:hypothetical protein